MLTVVDLILLYNGIGIRANLDAGQCVIVNVILKDEAASVVEKKQAALQAVVDLIVTHSGIAVLHPHAHQIVRVDPIAHNLALAAVVNVDAAGEAVVDVTVDHSGIGASFHLETCDSVRINVV